MSSTEPRISDITAAVGVLTAWVNTPSFEASCQPLKSNGMCADLLKEVKDARLAAEKVAEKIKAAEDAIKEHLVNTFSVGGDTGASGLKYRAQLTTKTKPTAEDWPAIHGYIIETGEFDLLQKRLLDTAVEGRWEAGIEIPGVGKVIKKDISLTKVG